MRRVQEIRGRVDAVILTIRADERGAVDERVGPLEQYTGRRTYRVGRLSAEGKHITVALYRLPEQGNSAAQAASADVILDLNPTLIVLVGIAGAVPSPEFTLGDVLVATRIVDLRVQALVPKSLPELSVRSESVHAALADRISNLIEPSDWSSHSSISYPRPQIPLTSDRFTADEEWTKKVRDYLEPHVHAPRAPRYLSAEIASSDSLIKDAGIVKHWLQAVRKLEGFEMEAAGVMAAASQTHVHYPVLVVRGISDIVGYRRDPEWTAYACHSAAAFAVALLRSGQLRGIGPLWVQAVELPLCSHLHESAAIPIRPSESSGTVPTRASLRRLLEASLKAGSFFDAFCADHFPEVAAEYSSGMLRTDKETLLLRMRSPKEILERLRKAFPEQVREQESLLEYE